MKKVKYLGHQGDVAIFEVDEFPASERVVDKQTGNAILAYGELSGHAHQFEHIDSVNVFRINDDLYKDVLFIEPKRDAKLVHGKARDFVGIEADNDYHNAVVLKEGKKYITGIVQETDWLTRTIRKVVD